MPGSLSPDIAQAAVAIARSHPHVPALNVLDLVMTGRHGAGLDSSVAWLLPFSPFGGVLAAAFDRGMTPEEWGSGSIPPADPVMIAALLQLWPEGVAAVRRALRTRALSYPLGIESMHFSPWVAPARPCWHCSSFVAMMYKGTAAMCTLRDGQRVRSMSAHGCSA